jgi:hypothetical protein
MPISQGKIILSSSAPFPLAGAVASRSFALAAPGSNQGTIYVGGANTPASEGFPMEPGDKISIDGGGLEDLYIRGTSGDSMNWLASA